MPGCLHLVALRSVGQEAEVRRQISRKRPDMRGVYTIHSNRLSQIDRQQV